MSNTGGEADHRDLRMVRIKVGSHETQPALSMIEDTSNLNPNEYSNDVFIYPAEWLCLASPVLRAMLTGTGTKFEDSLLFVPANRPSQDTRRALVAR
jgi:hypothetical protein